ncbi:hypothetical protein [Reyranella sp.]|uniref:hypothetical protein n=1 Tax=Reyranella sp. TaxID=1929291 RepID=UPI0011F5C1DE|nr:hypothetical protein [Reyranella sp.]TAJ87620.1 MAG: hypothetical protein EPO50_11605 [Reyranella sp.]
MAKSKTPKAQGIKPRPVRLHPAAQSMRREISWLAEQRRRSNEQTSERFLRRVIGIVEKEGFVALPGPKPFDFTFNSQIKQSRSISTLVGQAEQRFDQMNDGFLSYSEVDGGRLVLLVDERFSSRFLSRVGENEGVFAITTPSLRQWLLTLKIPLSPRPKRTSEQQTPREATSTTRSLTIRRAIRTNTDQIIVSTEAIARTVDEKLKQLRDYKPNSPEATATRNVEISEYEALKAKVVALQAEVAKFRVKKTTVAKAEKAARTFGDTVHDWWQKDHARVLGNAADGIISSGKVGVLLSAVGLCQLMNIHSEVLYAAAGAILGGRDVASAITKAWRHK